jgi:thiamine biosynthesis protein ThiI
MGRVTQVLATTNEISLKGGNRKWFERTLTDNVRLAVDDLPVASVTRPAWRVLVSFTEEIPFAEVARRLGTVFGIGAIMAVRHVGFTFDELRRALDEQLEGLSPSSFAVRCLRSDKTFPMTSPEVERAAGTVVQDRTGWPVDLRDPDLTIHVLIDENGVYTWTRRIAGPGGLPVGVSGRAACLLSGGIDSPVAAYMMMKRGMRLDFVHFHSVPRTDPASLEKVRDLVRVLNRYQGRSRLAMVPLLTIQEQIAARCPAPLRVLLYRRFMLGLAERVALRFKARALITGESLGQVASQTVENLAAVETVASLPVLRPLIGLDKQQIIDIARRAGTFELSIQPHFDCCSFLMPDSPATKSYSDELAAAETALDVTALVTDALEHAEVSAVDDAAAWDQIPVPAGAES